MTSELKELIDYRLKLAKETLSDSLLMIENLRLRSAVNRLYYACYYAVIALLLSHDLSSKSHKGTKNLFNQYIIDKGLLSRDYGKFYSRLFNARTEQDYQEFIDIDLEEVLDW